MSKKMSSSQKQKHHKTSQQHKQQHQQHQQQQHHNPIQQNYLTTYYNVIGQTLQNLPRNTIETFSKLKTDDDRYEYVNSLDYVKRSISAYIQHQQQQLLSQVENHPRKQLHKSQSHFQFNKSDEKAKIKRLEGNEFYKNGNFQAAHRCYNEAVLLAIWPQEFLFSPIVDNDGNENYINNDIFTEKHNCTNNDSINGKNGHRINSKDSSPRTTPSSSLKLPPTALPPINVSTSPQFDLETSGELCLALANRSAVFMKLGDNEACIDDIDRSIRFNYPPTQMHKLLERKMKCLKALNKLQDVCYVFEQLKEALVKSCLNEKQTKKVEEEAKQLLKIFPRDAEDEQDKECTMINNSENISSDGCSKQMIDCNRNLNNNKPEKIQETGNRSSSSNAKNNTTAKNCNFDDSKLMSSLEPTSQLPIKTTFNSVEGRDVIATRDLKTGEIIMSENTAAKILHQNCFRRRCYSCFNNLKFNQSAVIPCPRCAVVAFCSDQCQQNACNSLLASHGDVECGMLPYMLMAETGNIARLALRVVLMELTVENNGCVTKDTKDDVFENGKLHHDASKANFCEIAENDNKLVTNNIVGTSSTINTDSTKINVDLQNKSVPPTIFNLLTHSDKRPPVELFQYTLLALFIVQLLDEVMHLFENGNIFNTKVKNSEEQSCQSNLPQKSNQESSITTTMNQQSAIIKVVKNKLKLGSMLLTVLQIITCNGIEINENQISSKLPSALSPLSPPTPSLSDMIPESIGLALYPNISMFNHSCFPDADLIFQASKCIVRLIKPIKNRNSIKVDYGYLFYAIPKHERRECLKGQYFFDCQCRACLADWPTMKNLRSQASTFSGNFRKKLNSSLERAQRLEIDRDTRSILEEAIDGEMKMLGDGVPSKEIVGCISTLKRCYRMLGNISK